MALNGINQNLDEFQAAVIPLLLGYRLEITNLDRQYSTSFKKEPSKAWIEYHKRRFALLPCEKPEED